MSQLITRRVRLSRRFFLKGLTLSQAPVIIGLPPLVSMFNSTGTAYAAETNPSKKTAPFDRRFVLWFNGNGIPERYWIPDRTGADYDVTACLAPLARLHEHVHVLSGARIGQRLCGCKGHRRYCVARKEGLEGFL